MGKPRLLDAYSGAGGAGMGYHLAGFEVIGVDIKHQSRYPFEFHQGDAIQFIREHGHEFDVIHALPPCQRFSSLKAWTGGSHENHPDLIDATRDALIAAGCPYVIENVVGAPVQTTVMLCGSMFGLAVRRHRLFESNIFIPALRCDHNGQGQVIAVYGDHPQDSRIGRGSKARRAKSLCVGQSAMGIDWMDWRTLTQAIPPAYTHYIGSQLIAALASQEAA